MIARKNTFAISNIVIIMQLNASYFTYSFVLSFKLKILSNICVQHMYIRVRMFICGNLITLLKIPKFFERLLAKRLSKLAEDSGMLPDL